MICHPKATFFSFELKGLIGDSKRLLLPDSEN